MTMFLNFLSFELKLRLKSISTYVYFLVFALIGSLSIVAPDSFAFVGPGKVMLNGPYAALRMYLNLSFFGLLLMAGIFGPSILRDFQQNTYQLLFTKPIGKYGYLGGRWLGSILTTIGIFFGLYVGQIAGSFAWWADKTRLLPINQHLLLNDLKLFLDYPVIQIFFVGSLFFMIAALTRNIVVVYLQGVALFAVYLILLTALQTTRSLNLNTPGIFDPIGFITIRAIARYWTVVEQNTLIPIWNGVFLWNRLLYIGVGFLSVIAAFVFFPMRSEGLGAKASKRKKNNEEELEGPPAPRFRIELPHIVQLFDTRTSLAQLLSLTRIRMKNIFKEIPFWGIALVMIVNTMSNAHFAGKVDDANVWPVTMLMVQAVEGSSLLFMFIVATMYAGELVWREKDTRFQQIHDALPTSEWLDWASRFIAMCSIQLVLLVVVMICGITSQVIAGYYNFELTQYLQELFIVTFPMLAQFCMFALLVQSLVNNKYVGHAITIAFAVVPSFIQGSGWEDRLYLFNWTSPYTYSDMNGYGHFKAALFWSLAYWVFWTLLLIAIGMIFSPRGTDVSWKHRVRNAKQRTPKLMPYVAAFAALTAATGVWYFYNTHVLNWYHTAKMDRHIQAEYERKYKKYERLPQPKIIAVDTKVDISPEKRTFDAWGTYWITNKTDKPIDEIHLTDAAHSFYAASFDRPSTLSMEDALEGYRIFKLATALIPGETMKMFFHVGYASHGFRNHGEVPQLAYNGTFFDQDYMPKLGYNRGQELSNPVYRRDEKLGAYEELAPRGDPYYKDVNLFTTDSDWIKYHTIVSTSGDQIAISPGYLTRKWVENGRNYYEYSMGDTEVLDFYDYNSGRYEVKSEPYQGINIEVYHDRKHPYDVDDMIAASKGGLDYLQKNFGPFQFKQYRVIEYPRYRSFAQSFPNTIPFSEGIGFIGRLEKPEDIDFTYFVTAHELGHQWWAHQLIGGAVKGSNMMSESLAEYSALRVMEKKYGTKNMRKFLRFELDGYLRGRAGEVRHEPPITLVENEPYVWYQKGSLVFYALSDYIGEDTLNSALRSLLEKWKFKGPPYPDTRDLVSALREKTPQDLQYVVTDMFEKITLYDNKVEEATISQTPDHRWKVHMVVSSKKLYADGDGKESPAPLHDLVEVGVMTGPKDREEALHIEKVWLTQEKTPIDFIVDKRPDRAGIDPFSKLIDRNPEDNLMDVEEKK